MIPHEDASHRGRIVEILPGLRSAARFDATLDMRKLLVANRSEIAIRCFRAATELGLRTVAVYSYEDRFSLHRFKADEAFLIGPPKGGEPVRAYLNIDALDRGREGAGRRRDSSGLRIPRPRTPAFARACDDGRHHVRRADARAARHVRRQDRGEAAGRRRPACRRCPGTETALDRRRRGRGGGRAHRLSRSSSRPASAAAAAACASSHERRRARRTSSTRRSAKPAAAFGRPEVFLERYIPRAKHIEVQILGDAHGNLVHLWERDCSVQRRHQKVVEVAPSIDLAERSAARRSATRRSRLCRAVGYRNAGTVEFLLDVERGEFFFIEVNPRIQVEHTVTEVVTGIDLVRSQILVAQGHALHERAGRHPAAGRRSNARGVRDAVPHHDRGSRRTTSSPTTAGSRPIARPAASPSGSTAATASAARSSRRTSTRCWSRSRRGARRSRRRCSACDRALREFRIRGVKTNIPFLENLIGHPTFRRGEATTTFIDDTPELFQFRAPRDRATKLLVVPRRRHRQRPAGRRRARSIRRASCRRRCRRRVDLAEPPPPGTRQKLQELGPERFAEWVRGEQRLLLTDTTMRDAHQSLLATRVRTYDMLAVADAVARLDARTCSASRCGAARRSTRRCGSCRKIPWERLTRAAAADPEHPVPDAAAREQRRRLHELSRQRRPRVRQAKRRARHRRLPHLRLAELDRQHAGGDRGGARARRSAICEAAICYTGDILDPGAHEVLARVLRAAGQGAGRDGHAHPRASRTWPGCASRTRRTRW